MRRWPRFRLPSARVDGLRWAIPKTDRLLIPSGAMATKFVILDAVRQRRGSRDYILQQALRAPGGAGSRPSPRRRRSSIPPFNPFKLYANTTPLDAAEPSEDGQQDAAVKIVELLGGVIPSEDGQELGAEEVADAGGAGAGGRGGAGRAAAGLRRRMRQAAGDVTGRTVAKTAAEPPPPNTSVLAKIGVRERGRRRRPRGPRGARHQGPARRHPGAHPAAHRAPRPGRPAP